MPAWLTVKGLEKKHSLPRLGNFCIGRDQDSDLCLSDPKTSRNHVIVQHTSRDEYIIIDIASKNGCFVNNKRLYSPGELQNGDQIRIGDTKIDFFKDKSTKRKQDLEQTVGFGFSVQDYIEQEVIDTKELNIQEITILVADIRGFTTLTETLPIEIIASIMNQWFESTTDCVAAREGVLDKFIGDCVYARWTKIDDPLIPALNALKTACDLNRISHEINQEFNDIPFPLNIGVGINTGNAALDIGVENTAMGDAVNLAFRLETHSKVVGKNLVLSENTWKHLPQRDWKSEANKIYVKGKKESINIVSLDFTEVEEYLKAVKLDL